MKTVKDVASHCPRDGAANDSADTGTLTLADLPPADTRRWVTQRKAQVVAGVRAGLLSVDEACQRYGLSLEEFDTWKESIDRHGVESLRVTRLQEYRLREG